FAFAMWKNLTGHLPAVVASVALTGAALGGYIYHLHNTVIPGIRAEQRPVPVAEVPDGGAAAAQFANNAALVSAMALMQATQMMLPLAMTGDGDRQEVVT